MVVVYFLVLTSENVACTTNFSIWQFHCDLIHSQLFFVSDQHWKMWYATFLNGKILTCINLFLCTSVGLFSKHPFFHPHPNFIPHLGCSLASAVQTETTPPWCSQKWKMEHHIGIIMNWKSLPLSHWYSVNGFSEGVLGKFLAYL